MQKQTIIIGLRGQYNPELLKKVIALLQEEDKNLEILHANHAHDGGPGIYIGSAEDIASAGIKVVQVPADEIEEHTLPGIGEGVRTILRELRTFARKEAKGDQEVKELLTGKSKAKGGPSTPELPGSTEGAKESATDTTGNASGSMNGGAPKPAEAPAS